MAGLTNQSPRVTTGYLDTVNDPAPGVPVSTAQISGSIVQPYAGQVGGKLVINDTNALALYKTTKLYNGIYAYVLTKSGSTTAPAVGLPAFWYDRSNATVTPDLATGEGGDLAGFYLGAPTKGNYCFIQVAGKANVYMKTPITKATPVDGDMVFIDVSTVEGDVIADATNITAPILKLKVGIIQGTVTAGAVNLVVLDRSIDDEFSN